MQQSAPQTSKNDSLRTRRTSPYTLREKVGRILWSCVQLTLFRCSFTVDVPGPDDLAAQGSFGDHEYAFTRSNRRVAVVSKSWFSLSDSYGVEVQDGEDPMLILASTVVIDLCCDKEGRKQD